MISCQIAADVLNRTTEVQAAVYVLGPENDQQLIDYCASEGWPFIGGSETDLTDRYRTALDETEADGLVRITSDCWDINPGRISEAAYLLLTYSYVSNTIVRSYAEGQDVQACSAEAYRWIDDRTRQHREHVFFDFETNGYFRDAFHAHGFEVHNLMNEDNEIFCKTSIDTEEELRLARLRYEVEFEVMEREKEEGFGPGGDGHELKKGVSIH